MFENLPKLPFPIIDTHAHYDDDSFCENIGEITDSMSNYGVKRIINNAVDLENSAENILKMAENNSLFLSAVGVHPESVDRYGKTLDREGLKRLSQHSSVVAIGEIGLDYHYSTDKKAQQIEVFYGQCEVADELGLPVIIHDRDAHGDTFDIVKKLRPKGVVHCFSGSKELALQYVDLGLFIGIGGVITFKNARKLVEIAESIPMENILLETDAPYLAPVPFRGKQCNSALIIYTAEKIAEIKNISTETVLKTAAENSVRLFGDKLKI
jgi:TatD DNase family protein